MKKDLIVKIKDALSNEDLQKGLEKAIKNFKDHRQQALCKINFNEIQCSIKKLKEKNLSQFNQNLQNFKENCKKNGMEVFETANSQEACEQILAIIKKHQGKKVVKVKSMVSEEIELNDFLEKNYITPVETDLGEWLVQLAGEKPSHITAPAMHMTRDRVAKLLKEKLNVDISPDPKEITKFAKNYLKKEFLEADIGLSGANILVAETGSAIIVTNEGNGRLATTLPDVHIILATPEKIVENLEEAAQILNILPKSATGQNLTSYVSIISGPSKTADIEKELVIGVHGPEHIYVVLVDNGRSEILKQPEFKDILTCIKCGACLGMCPVYNAIGGHVFGKIYMGGMGAILTTFIENIESSKDLISLCAGCGLCKTNCPANIDIPQMILKLKETLASNANTPKQLLLNSLFFNKGILKGALSASAMIQGMLGIGQPEITNLPWKLSSLTKFRTLPTPAPKSLTTLTKEQNTITPFDETKKSVIFYPGCLIEYIYPNYGLKAISIMQKLGFNVLYPEELICCGIPALYTGEHELYKKLVLENKQVLSQFKEKNPISIVTLCPSCTQGLKREDLIDDMGIIDFSQIVYEHIDKIKDDIYEIINITYHPSCHYAKDEKNITYTHKILKELYKENLIEYYDMYNCCGSAGSYAIEFPDISEKIIQNKIKNINNSGAKTVITDCPSCYMQISGYLNKQNSNVTASYITDIFDLKE